MTNFFSERESLQFPHCTVWKNEKFIITQKIFRQNNYLVILLVKPLFWRNFCQKSVRVNFRFFHSVSSKDSHAQWKFVKNFVKSTEEDLVSNCFHEIFFKSFLTSQYCAVRKNERFTVTKKKEICEINYLCSPTIVVTKFLPKQRESKFPKYPHCISVLHWIHKKCCKT